MEVDEGGGVEKAKVRRIDKEMRKDVAQMETLQQFPVPPVFLLLWTSFTFSYILLYHLFFKQNREDKFLQFVICLFQLGLEHPESFSWNFCPAVLGTTHKRHRTNGLWPALETSGSIQRCSSLTKAK